MIEHVPADDGVLRFGVRDGDLCAACGDRPPWIPVTYAWAAPGGSVECVNCGAIWPKYQPKNDKGVEHA